MEVYVLYSDEIERHYVGQTAPILERMQRHNAGKVKSTAHGSPWRLIWSKECSSRSEAVVLERKIKKRGAARFLKDNGV